MLQKIRIALTRWYLENYEKRSVRQCGWEPANGSRCKRPPSPLWDGGLLGVEQSAGRPAPSASICRKSSWKEVWGYGQNKERLLPNCPGVSTKVNNSTKSVVVPQLLSCLSHLHCPGSCSLACKHNLACTREEINDTGIWCIMGLYCWLCISKSIIALTHMVQNPRVVTICFSSQTTRKKKWTEKTSQTSVAGTWLFFQIQEETNMTGFDILGAQESLTHTKPPLFCMWHFIQL